MSTNGAPRLQGWKELYHLAILETDPAKLPPPIADAHKAILDRIEGTLAKPVSAQQQRLNHALCGLRVLREEVDSWRNRSHSDGAGLRKSG